MADRVRRCAYCNDHIPPERRSDARYCSDAHKVAAHRARRRDGSADSDPLVRLSPEEQFAHRLERIRQEMKHLDALADHVLVGATPQWNDIWTVWIERVREDLERLRLRLPERPEGNDGISADAMAQRLLARLADEGFG